MTLALTLAAAGFVVVSGALALHSLSMARSVVVAGLRMAAQLVLLGVVLTWLFRVQAPWLLVPVSMVMAAFAGFEIRARQERYARTWGTAALGAGALLGAAWLLTVPVLVALEGDGWWTFQIAIPLFGMVIGSAMTGVALALKHATEGLVRERAAVEGKLAQGMTFRQATGPLRKAALGLGLLPTINAMAAMGVVTIPGLMTGQVLAGTDPTEAAQVQIVVMVLILCATVGGAWLAVEWIVRRATDARHRLRLDLLP
ncbi:MAG: ABC transporter permease [Shimia sp.]